MKNKIISILLINILLLNYFFAINSVIAYTRDGGNNLNTIATIINDDIWLDAEYNAYNKGVPYTNVDIYDYETSVKKQCTGNGNPILYEGNENKYYYTLHKYNWGEVSSQILCYTIRIGAGEKKLENIATFIFRDSVIYNGKKYDFKMNIKEINSTGNTEEQEVAVRTATDRIAAIEIPLNSFFIIIFVLLFLSFFKTANFTAQYLIFSLC